MHGNAIHLGMHVHGTFDIYTHWTGTTTGVNRDVHGGATLRIGG